MDSGIGRITTILVCLLIIGLYAYSCAARVELTAPMIRKIKPKTTTPDCGHLYNNGQHKAWAECMGVGYK